MTQRNRKHDRRQAGTDVRKPITVRLRPEVYERLQRRADKEVRSLGSQSALLIEEGLREQAEA